MGRPEAMIGGMTFCTEKGYIVGTGIDSGFRHWQAEHLASQSYSGGSFHSFSRDQ